MPNNTAYDWKCILEATTTDEIATPKRLSLNIERETTRLMKSGCFILCRDIFTDRNIGKHEFSWN